MVMRFLSFTLLALVASAQNGPETAKRPDKRFHKRVVISGLAGPWEITWGPDGKLWTTERAGKRVTRVDPKTGEKTVAITIEEVSAPGGQDGLLGMALHPELLKGTGKDFVYVAYTYRDEAKGPDPTITDPKSPYRFLYAKIVRLRYSAASGTLSEPVNVITGLPAGNDHVAGRLKFGPDQKLYLTLGIISWGTSAWRSKASGYRRRRSWRPRISFRMWVSLCGSIWMVRCPRITRRSTAS
jgi:glucose/arabinose dehydrogenase